MEYNKQLLAPLVPSHGEKESAYATTELEIQEKIDIWVERHMKDFLNRPKFCYWATTTVEIPWNYVDTTGLLEARLRKYYVSKLQLVYKENKRAIDSMQQKLTVTKKGVELGLVLYISNELYADNCINAFRRFFGLPEKTPINNTTIS